MSNNKSEDRRLRDIQHKFLKQAEQLELQRKKIEAQEADILILRRALAKCTTDSIIKKNEKKLPPSSCKCDQPSGLDKNGRCTICKRYKTITLDLGDICECKTPYDERINSLPCPKCNLPYGYSI